VLSSEQGAALLFSAAHRVAPAPVPTVAPTPPAVVPKATSGVRV
jgi:hypothetical protein